MTTNDLDEIRRRARQSFLGKTMNRIADQALFDRDKLLEYLEEKDLINYALTAEVELLKDDILAVRALHERYTDHRDLQWCEHCDTLYPCSTLRTLGIK